jgi:hypothetical protein
VASLYTYIVSLLVRDFSFFVTCIHCKVARNVSNNLSCLCSFVLFSSTAASKVRHIFSDLQAPAAMDNLGAVITIAGVVLGSLKIVSTVLWSSDEASALINEVTDLQVVLNDVRSIEKGRDRESQECIVQVKQKCALTSRL